VRVISFAFISLIYIYTYIYKEVQGNRRIRSENNVYRNGLNATANKQKKIYERDWFGSHTYNRFSSLSFLTDSKK
jgi:hypothetical protein